MTRKEFQSVATQFSKEQLAAAVCDSVDGWTLSHISNRLFNAEYRRLHNELRAASDAVIEALENIHKWTKAMADKYGDGNRFSLMRLSENELKEGSTLEQRLHQLQKLEDKLQRKYDKLMEVEHGKD